MRKTQRVEQTADDVFALRELIVQTLECGVDGEWAQCQLALDGFSSQSGARCSR